MNPQAPNYYDPHEEDTVAPATEVTENPVPDPQIVEKAPRGIEWEASEYLQHNNGALWYLGFFAVVVILIAFAVFFHAWTFVVVIVVMAIAAMIHVRRPPRILRYVLDDAGLAVGDRLHPYGDFKSFSVIRDGAFYAVLLIPVKRFMPSTIVYFDEADGERIVDEFGMRMPMESRGLDSIDRFLRFIRF